MERHEAKHIVKIILVAFPKYLDKKNEADDPEFKLTLLRDKLLERNYQTTLDKVNKYIETSPYEPSFSDILPPKPYKPDTEWEKYTYE